MKHITQLADRLINTLQNDSIFFAAWVGFVMDANIDSVNINNSSTGMNAVCDNGSGMNRSLSRCGEDLSAGSRFAGSGLNIFTYRLGRLFALGNDYLNSAKQTVNRLAEQPAWGLSIRLVLEPETTHRSRERRQLAMFSF